MPEIKHYKVTQTRIVEVMANNSLDACLIATEAFDHGQDINGKVDKDHMPYEVWGDTVSKVIETGVATELAR